MKKSIFVIAAIFLFTVSFTACKETKKEEVKAETEVKEEVAVKDVYQCPMDCEEGKTYVEAGSCPVCKMDLKMKATDTEEMKHAENCKCLESGECKCEDGKCQCLAEVASKTKECGKCEPGKCECKAEVIPSNKCKSGGCSCKA